MTGGRKANGTIYRLDGLLAQSRRERSPVERADPIERLEHPYEPSSDRSRHHLAVEAGEARIASAQAAHRYAKSFKSVHATGQQAAAGRQALREAISRYAGLLKQLGTPPERTLFLLKRLVRESVSPVIDEVETMLLLQNVVVWCVEGYYNNSSR